MNPSYENEVAPNTGWTFVYSESSILIEYASEYSDQLATNGEDFLVVIVPENASASEYVQISQVIGLCSGEGRYVFSVDAVLLSTEQSCYVFAWAYQGTGPYPPPANVPSWGSGAYNVGPSWTTITFGVLYTNAGSGTA